MASAVGAGGGAERRARPRRWRVTEHAAVGVAAAVADPFDVRRARGASGLLGEFNQAGVLAAADVHVSTRLTELAGEPDESVAVGFALAARAPRLAPVHFDLAGIRERAAVDPDEPVDLSALPWPELEP